MSSTKGYRNGSTTEPVNCFDIRAEDIVRVEARSGIGSTWIYDPADDTLTDPADRCGDRYRIHAVCGDSWGQRAFLLAVADSHWPRQYLVFGDSFQDAWDWFCCDETVLPSIRVEPEDAADYADEDRQYNADGVHIDTDHVQGAEITVIAVTMSEGGGQ